MIIPDTFAYVLRRIYGLPASITIVTGLWKHGKTNFALMLNECCRDLGLIDQTASNVETFDNPPRIEYIKSLSRLKTWFFQGRGKKMFLYDEVLESTPKRRAMSQINVEWVKTIPQLSKARGHLVAITQETNLTESVFFNPVFCRGLWTVRKQRVEKGIIHKVNLRSQLFKIPYNISEVPPTTIKYDPYLLATFQLKERSLVFDSLPMEFQVLKLYAEQKSFTDIKNELGLKHWTQVKRLLQKACRVTLTVLQEPSEGDRVRQISKSIES